MLYIGLGIVGAIVVAIFAFALYYDNIYVPRHVLASVDGTKIRREDYWKYRSFVLINQINVYTQYANLIGGDQATQYQQLAQQAQTELAGVWGSKSVDAATLDQMVQGQIYLHNMGKLGLSITNQDVQNYTLNQFAPSDAPLITPTVTPTLIPQRAAWATETAIAQQTAAAPTPTPHPGAAGSPAASPAAAVASPVASPAGSPVATPVASPVASPGASPAASPVASPAESPTPNPTQAQATAQASFNQYKSVVFKQAHMSQSDYDRLVVRPSLAQQMVTDKIDAQVGQTADQVHAAHILIATEDLANKIYQEVTQPGADFAAIAKKESNDTATAANGGDLGWFTRGEMPKQFEDVAFSLKPGQISKPFNTPYGWEIVKVYAHENRAMTDDQISALQTYLVNQWLDQQKAQTSVSVVVTPAPTPTSSTFVPPPGAPTPPPTPTPVASPAASPVASPAPASPAASPVTSPTVRASG